MSWNRLPGSENKDFILSVPAMSMNISFPAKKTLLLYFLSFLVGAVFLYSGYSKLLSLEYFELLLLEAGLSTWQIAPFFARFLVSLELFAGLLFLLSLNPRRIPYKAGIFLLTAFSIYLILILIKDGNNENCGCFGDALPMSPLAAIIKNGLLAGALVVLDRFHAGATLKYQGITLSMVAATLFALPFIVNPVETGANNAVADNELPADNIDLLYQSETNLPPAENLREGKWVVAFLSLKCSHCRLAARKLALMKKENPDLSLYFILNGDEEDLTDFLQETKSGQVPHSFFLGPDFPALSGYRLPVVYQTDQGQIIRKINVQTLTAKGLKDWQ